MKKSHSKKPYAGTSTAYEFQTEIIGGDNKMLDIHWKLLANCSHHGCLIKQNRLKLGPVKVNYQKLYIREWFEIINYLLGN